MNTNNTPRKFHLPDSEKEMQNLTKKVQASNTYKQSYYAIWRKEKLQGDTWTQIDQFLCADIGTIEQVQNDIDKLHKWLLLGAETSDMRYTIDIDNMFDNYHKYVNAGGIPYPRALQWEIIKTSFEANERLKKIYSD